MSALYFGDNLQVLREEIKYETVDLVYLDPPFNSDTNYNISFQFFLHLLSWNQPFEWIYL